MEPSRNLLFGLSFASGLISFFAIFPSTYLFFYHIWLWRHKLSTYGHIVQKRRKMRRTRSKEMSHNRRNNKRGNHDSSKGTNKSAGGGTTRHNSKSPKDVGGGAVPAVASGKGRKSQKSNKNGDQHDQVKSRKTLSKASNNNDGKLLLNNPYIP